MTIEQWAEQYRVQKDRAERVSRMLTERARQACTEAGLDGDLLGIHPHNAMCDYRAGNPWAGIDYQKIRLSLHLQDRSFYPYRLLEQWHRKAWERVAR